MFYGDTLTYRQYCALRLAPNDLTGSCQGFTFILVRRFRRVHRLRRSQRLSTCRACIDGEIRFVCFIHFMS